MFGMGFGELLVVLVIVPVVFGPGRLPRRWATSARVCRRSGSGCTSQEIEKALKSDDPVSKPQARSLTGAVSRGGAFTPASRCVCIVTGSRCPLHR